MDTIKTVGSLGAGALFGRETALYLVNGLSAKLAPTFLGPLPDPARIELATGLAAGLALLVAWLHHRFTRHRPTSAPPTEDPLP